MDNADQLPLPLPESSDLNEIVREQELRRIYRYLYERRNDPPTTVEIEGYRAEITGAHHSQRGRRVRQLYPFFWIDKIRNGRRPPYFLPARKPPRPKGLRVDRKTRAKVLQPQRCAMCGRTPLQDGVKLDVDHKLPQDWVGTNNIENLQPLCEECNNGKKDHFHTYDPYVEQIQQAATYNEPQRRIGELLAVFGDEWVRSDVIEIVASAKEYQDDWHRRMRDLRFIGWDYENRRKREGGRVSSYYRMTKSAPWPENIIAAIRAEAARRGETSSLD